MTKEKQEKLSIWQKQILQNSQDSTTLKFEISHDDIMEILGKPDYVSTMKSG